MKCKRCDIGLVGKPYWQLIEGWVQKRQAGGTNHIKMKRHHPTYLCIPCMHLRESGLKDHPHPGQTSLI